MWAVAIKEVFPEKVLLLEDDNSFKIEYHSMPDTFLSIL